MRVERGRGDVVQKMSARWRLFMMASSDASSSSSSSPAVRRRNASLAGKWTNFGCGRDSAGDKLSNVFRFAIGSERVVDGTTVDPPLPLRRKLAGDEQL